MKTRIMLLLAAGVALAGCDVERPFEPTGRPDALIGDSPLRPSFLIGQSPLAPLAEPLDVTIWYWITPKTGEVRHLVEVGVLVAEERIENAAESGARLETTTIFSQNGKSIVKPAASVDPLTGVSSRATGDGYALVVIALPLTSRESDALLAALARGDVELAVETELAESNGAGGWDIMDDLGSLLLADPRPSPLDLPPIFN